MKRCIVLFITFCCAVVSNAQTNGIVTDGEKGLPLAGVNIYLQKDSVGIGVIRNDNLVKNMSYEKLLYLGLLSVCVLLGSCVEKNVFNAFDKVERYMDVYSDSALLLLEQIPHPEKLRGKQRADYVLLLTQARDKNYLDSMQSDSFDKVWR